LDKDRVAGSAKQVKGVIEEIAGKILGDAKLQVDGKLDREAGKAQNLKGSIADAAKPKSAPVDPD
jgi:uncharacterized protein YjbJ (UPF0337 family)